MRRVLGLLSVTVTLALAATATSAIPIGPTGLDAAPVAAAEPLPYTAGPPTPNSVIIDSNRVWFTKPGQIPPPPAEPNLSNCGWVQYLEVEDRGDQGIYRRLAYQDGELIQTLVLSGFRDQLITSSSIEGASPEYSSLVAPAGTRLSFINGAGLGCGTTPEARQALNEYVSEQEAAAAEIEIEVWYDGPDGQRPNAVIDPPGRFGPGEYQFVGTSSDDPDGGAVRYLWNFGDGETSTNGVAGHTYDKPGTYTVTLTVTDDEDDTDVASVQVEVEAPQLGVGLILPDEIALFSTGEEIPITVRLRATEGVGNLTDVAFVDGALEVSPTTAGTITEGPTPEVPADIVLEPGGEPLEFLLKVTAGRAGSIRFSSTVTAIDAADRPVGPVTVERNGRIGQLDVVISTDPGEVDLEEDENGPTPKPVTITVAVTNPLTVPVDVTLDVDDPKFLNAPLGDEDYLPFVYGELDADGNPPDPAPLPDIVVGTIPAGETKTESFPALALDDGTIEFDILATGTGEQNGETITVRGADDHVLKIRSDVVFFFDAEIDEDSLQDPPAGSGQWVRGGSEWKINGRIENRSSEETIEVQLIPVLMKNSGLGVPVPDGRVLSDPDCAVGLVQILEAGDEMDFVAAVRTIGSGGTASEVHYMPMVVIIEDDGERTPLTDDQILMADGADEHRVSVDVREVPPTPPGLLREVWAFSSAFVGEIVNLVVGLVGLIWALLPLNPNNILKQVPAAMHKYADYVVTLYGNIPPGERGNFEAFYIQTLVSDLGMKAGEAASFVQNEWREWNEAMAREVEAGDTEAIAARMGRLIGGNIDTIVPVLAGLCKMSRATPLGRAALRANDAKIAEDLARLGDNVTVNNIPTGSFLTRNLRRNLWGIDDAMDRRVQAFVDQWGIVIGVRRRGPGSIAKVEAGTHYGKIYHVKAKNIDEIDIEFLGFPNDLDTAMIAKPPTRAELDAAIGGLSTERQAQVRTRWNQRMDEWYGKPRNRNNPDGPRDFSTSERHKFEQWDARGTAPAPFEGAALDYRDNVGRGRSQAPDDTFTHEVPFDPIITRDAAGRPLAITPRVDQGQGLKKLTGDMDPVVVAKPDFSTMTEAQRVRFYEEAHALGFEHVESGTWNNPNGRAKYVADHSYYVEGSEALYTWIPKSQPRATRIDPRMSEFEGFNPVDAVHIYIRGSQVEWKSPEPTTSDFNQHEFDDNGGFVSPRTIFLIDEECANGDPAPSGLTAQAAGSCPLPYARGDDAIILRSSVLGGYEEWTRDGGWVPYTFGDVVDTTLLPLTVTSDDSAAGDSTVAILEGAEVGQGPGDEWFAVGDEVVIDPGGPNEEFATISGFGSLVFDAPLGNAHAAGTVVAVVEPAAKVVGIEFTDVSPSAWFGPAVSWAASEGITTGTGGGLFEPARFTDRAMLVTMVWRAAGSPVVTNPVPFTDVDLDAYYGPALRWAYSEGIILGTSPTTFEPHADAVRAHLVAVLWRWAGRPDATSTPFTDVEIGRYFSIAAAWAHEQGVSTGLRPGEFGPDVMSDRATLVTMLHRLLE